jgi:hypothetical protein
MSVIERFTVPFRLLICGALACAAAASAAPAAIAASTTCEGELAGGSYDDVVVPPRATCSLFGATVAQTVSVGRNATLNGGFVTIGGSLVAADAKNVRLTGFSVVGDVTIRGGGEVTIASSTVAGVVDVSGVNGFIAIIDNGSPGALGRIRVVDNILKRLDRFSTVGLNIASNQVQTDAEVSRNKGQVDKMVQGNTVGGTLSCIGNTEPFVGSFNTAASFEGQCSGPA